MKDFPQYHSPANNHELVYTLLDIGQCRFIYKLINQEYQRMLENRIHDKNDAVFQLLDHFKKYAYPASSEVIHCDQSLEDFIDKQDQQALNKLLAFISVPGAFCHD